MKRYINTDMLIQDIENSRANNNHSHVIAFQTHNAEHRHFIKTVLDQPVADVVEVVRCKDCKYLKGGTYCYLTLNYQVVRPEHFCSHGKIKE